MGTPMSVSKALSPRGWFTGGLVAAAVLIALAVPEASAQPSLVGSSVRIELFFPNLTMVSDDYGLLPVVAGAPELVSPAGNDEFCGTAPSTSRHPASTSGLPRSVLFRVVLPSSTASCSRLPQNFAVLSATLSPPPGGTPQSPGQGISYESTSVPCLVVRTSRRETISISISCSSKRRNLPHLRCASTNSAGQRWGCSDSGSVPTNASLEITFKQYQYGAIVVPGDGIASCSPSRLHSRDSSARGAVISIGMPRGGSGSRSTCSATHQHRLQPGMRGPALGHPAFGLPE